MKCDKCDKEATVHEVTIRGGKRHEKHLCEACAAAEGVAPQAAVHTPITDLLTNYITAQSDAAGVAAGGVAAGVVASSGGEGSTPGTSVAANTCPRCTLTYAQFRHSGLMGCADCYSAFEAQLTPLLARAHEGGTHHVGKTPKRPLARAAAIRAPAPATPDPAQFAQQIAQLNKKLADAITAEQYEKAAKIRDELRRLDPGFSRGGEP